MNKINSWDELKTFRENARKTAAESGKTVIAVGMGTCGAAAGARDTLDAFTDELARSNAENTEVVTTGCMGFCYAEPVVELRSADGRTVRYGNVDEKLAREIVKSHVCQGQVIKDAVIGAY